jgi:hypothetical protein
VVEDDQQDAAAAVDVEPAKQDAQGDHLQQEESQERGIFQDGGDGDVPRHPKQGEQVPADPYAPADDPLQQITDPLPTVKEPAQDQGSHCGPAQPGCMDGSAPSPSSTGNKRPDQPPHAPRKQEGQKKKRPPERTATIFATRRILSRSCHRFHSYQIFLISFSNFLSYHHH